MLCFIYSDIVTKLTATVSLHFVYLNVSTLDLQFKTIVEEKRIYYHSITI